MSFDLEGKWCCFACGLIFDPLEDVPQEQWDDMHCPDCGANDLGVVGEQE